MIQDASGACFFEDLRSSATSLPGGRRGRRLVGKRAGSVTDSASEPDEPEIPTDASEWTGLGVCGILSQALVETGLLRPTALEAGALRSVLLSGRREVLVRGGSLAGGTTALLVLAFQRALVSREGGTCAAPCVLYLCPDRETAFTVLGLGKKLASKVGVGVGLACEGLSASVQRKILNGDDCLDVVVCTPLTAAALLSPAAAARISLLCADHAEKLTDLPPTLLSSLPTTRQTVVTVPSNLASVSVGLLFGEDRIPLVLGGGGSRLNQEFVSVGSVERGHMRRVAALAALLSSTLAGHRCVVWLRNRSQRGVRRLGLLLSSVGLSPAGSPQGTGTCTCRRRPFVLWCEGLSCEDPPRAPALVQLDPPPSPSGHASTLTSVAPRGRGLRSVLILGDGEDDTSLLREIVSASSGCHLFKLPVDDDSVSEWEERLRESRCVVRARQEERAAPPLCSDVTAYGRRTICPAPDPPDIKRAHHAVPISPPNPRRDRRVEKRGRTAHELSKPPGKEKGWRKLLQKRLGLKGKEGRRMLRDAETEASGGRGRVAGMRKGGKGEGRKRKRKS